MRSVLFLSVVALHMCSPSLLVFVHLWFVSFVLPVAVLGDQSSLYLLSPHLMCFGLKDFVSSCLNAVGICEII